MLFPHKLYIIKYNPCIQNTENLCDSQAVKQNVEAGRQNPPVWAEQTKKEVSFMDTWNTFTLKAYAKINLGLDVVRRLPNGYHEVRMIMQTVGIFDELTFTGAESGIVVTTDSKELPEDENNLVFKAARIMFEKYGIQKGVKIHLKKNIPIAAGMAGGSSDAAATLKGLNRLFGVGAGLDELREMAVRIGADVPYCITGGTMLSEGIGEKLTPLPPAPEGIVLAVKPDISVSTKYVYENLHADTLTYHPDIDGMAEAVKAGNLKGIVQRMGNVLESVTQKEYPVIGQIKEILLRTGALGALMSGSGPTVFGIYTDRETARQGQQAIEGLRGVERVFLTGFVNPEEEER